MKLLNEMGGNKIKHRSYYSYLLVTFIPLILPRMSPDILFMLNVFRFYYKSDKNLLDVLIGFIGLCRKWC